jgi:Cof subfamily protein (haloacid dehalogenase superfamily)
MEKDRFEFIAMDLDGTILDKEYKMSPRVVGTLIDMKSRGKKLIAATGRVLASAIKHTSVFGGADGYVCSNGADIYSGDMHMIAQFHIEDAIARRLVEFARTVPSHFHAFISDNWNYEKHTPYVELYERRSGLIGHKVDFDSFSSLSFTKCMFMDERPRIEAIRSRLADVFGDSVEMSFSDDYILEIVTSGANKGAGLAACLKQMGGSLEKTIAFGDADNDESMLLSVGMGVAMTNAPDDLKRKVSRTAPSVLEDGVAVFLEGFFGPK